MATLSGTDIVVKFGTASPEVVVACATNCTFTLNEAELPATCKDSGRWKTLGDGGEKSWDVTFDALYQDDDAVGEGGFVDLSTLIITGPNTASVVISDGDQAGDNTWTGTAKLTSCALNGPDNENATYSGSFTGNGAIVHAVIT